MKPKIPEQYCVPIDISNHKQYLDILNTIRKDTDKIVIVQIDGYDEDDAIVETAQNMMILEKKEIVSEWYGTIAERGRGAIKYTFIKNREFFGYLSTFVSFFIGKNTKNGYEVECTNFGFDDIAFLGANNELLFYTTTHEGYADINIKYLKDIK